VGVSWTDDLAVSAAGDVTFQIRPVSLNPAQEESWSAIRFIATRRFSSSPMLHRAKVGCRSKPGDPDHCREDASAHQPMTDSASALS
jgi:hypothetical protein